MPSSPADALCQFVPPFMRFLRDGLVDLNLSPARFQILQALQQGGALSMVELAGRLSVTKRNITTLIDGMEKDGLAARAQNPEDRRSTLVRLTPAGEALWIKAAEVQREHLKGLLANLNAVQQQEMAKALTDLTEAMTALKS
ncbi:MAG: MarR family transcriptional regulator [Pseudomonadota bacterium]